MNYHNILHDNMLNGEGLRVVLFVSGCSHNCQGCHNPETHDPNSGIPFDQEAKKELFYYLSKDYTKGITFSGGDPLFCANRKEVLELCKEIKESFPDKDIWIYTGYTLESLDNETVEEMKKYNVVLVDGPFIEALKSPDKEWVGSSNQKIIKLN